MIKTKPPSLGYKKSIQKPQVRELRDGEIMPLETSNKLYVHEFGFWSICVVACCLPQGSGPGFKSRPCTRSRDNGEEREPSYSSASAILVRIHKRVNKKTKKSFSNARN
jgi:hypothetical protein